LFTTQFVNAHFRASDDVERRSRVGLELHEGKGCARQVQSERPDTKLNQLLPFRGGSLRHAVAQRPDIGTDFETSSQSDAHKGEREGDWEPCPKPLAGRGGLFE
jgi:hypothetical protein